MSTRSEETEAQKRRSSMFGRSLESALDGKSQTWLGAEVARKVGAPSPISGSAVSQWIGGKTEPSPVRVFAIEEVLGLRAGTLSRLLGYLPVSAKATTTVPDAIDSDPHLTDQARAMLRAAYREASRS